MWIYKGTAYAYSVDPLFSGISKSVKFWERVIETAYEEYPGIYKFHNFLNREVERTNGIITSPTGRLYQYERKPRKGEWLWPETDIANNIVQGFSAEVMAVIRVSLRNKLRKTDLEYKLINTIHDSLMLDLPDESVAPVAQIIKQCFIDLPGNFKKLFDIDLLVPFTCETEVGNNWHDMQKLVA